MFRWVKDLDLSGVIALLVVIFLFAAVAWPFVAWVARGESVRPVIRMIPQIEQELPAGFAALRVPVQPRIEYVRYAGNPPCLDLTRERPTIPFQIDVEVTAGVARTVTASGTANPKLDPHVQQVSTAWQGNLRYAFPFSGHFRVLVYPDLTWRVEWLSVGNLPPGDATVCYAISRYPMWSRYLLPLCGVGALTEVIVPPGRYSLIARKCRDQLGLPPDTRI